MPAGGKTSRQPGEAPAEATRDRAAQEHDLVGHGAAAPGNYPASRLEDGQQDVTPSAPAPSAAWDAVVQPERRAKHTPARDDLPLPEGK